MVNEHIYVYIYILLYAIVGGSGGFTSKSLSYTTFVFGTVT